MTTHKLKTWPVMFEGLLDGTKTAEVRRADRTFEVGDELLLREWDPGRAAYTGHEVSRRISRVDGLSAIGIPTHRLLSFAPEVLAPTLSTLEELERDTPDGS